MTIIEIDNFFTNHPLAEKYFAFPEADRAGCAAVAQRDVRAALTGCPVSETEENELVFAAIAEQTIFLLLNPEYLVGSYTHLSAVVSAGESKRFTGSQAVLGQRPAALIAPLLNRKISADTAEETAAMLNFSRG